MNILEDIKQLKAGMRELRKFGLVVGGVFAALGLFFLWRHKSFYPWFLTPGVVLVVVGGVFPRALKYVYLAWMAMAFVLGFVMAHIILTLFFFLVITPIGLIARLSGKDFLQLKLDKNAKSYWAAHERKIKSSADYERQF